MDSRKLTNQVFTIFGTIMIFFYLGLGIFVIFSSYLDYIDKPLRVIFGAPLLLYGIYRIFVSYNKIRENFFTKDEDE